MSLLAMLLIETQKEIALKIYIILTPRKNGQGSTSPITEPKARSSVWWNTPRLIFALGYKQKESKTILRDALLFFYRVTH